MRAVDVTCPLLTPPRLLPATASVDRTFLFTVAHAELAVPALATDAMPSSSGNSQTPSGSTPAPSASNVPSPGGSAGSASSTLSIPQSAPAGGLTILTPAQTATSYFKLAPSQPITFGWNFTYLLSTPTHLTVSAICENGNTYPVGPSDGVIPGTATSVVWDAWAWDQANPGTPLAQAKYTLNVWDERGPAATRGAGLFSPNSALQFALYSPQAYTPLSSGWQCSGCHSGSLARATSHPAFAAMIATLVVCLLSGYGLLRRAAH